MHNICWWYQLLWFNWAAAVRCLITSCSWPELWNCNKWNIKNEITRWLWEQISVLNFTKRSWDKEKTNYKGRSAYMLYKAQCYFAISDTFQDFFHFRAESAVFYRLVRLFLWWSIIYFVNTFIQLVWKVTLKTCIMLQKRFICSLYV